MNANELRMGNYVFDKYGNIESVFEISKYGDLYRINELDPYYYTSIPLTDEWLLKFGFVKVLDYPCFRLEGLQIEFNGFDSQWGSGLLDEKTVIKFVHQLQNLFFALKGKELTLK